MLMLSTVVYTAKILPAFLKPAVAGPRLVHIRPINIQLCLDQSLYIDITHSSSYAVREPTVK